MKQPLTSCALAILVGATALPCAAQHMKPGLWEMTTEMLSGGAEMDSAMAQMRKQMDAMQPAERKMMDDMLAKQGMSRGGATGRGFAMKICMTPEMAANSALPMQQHGDCKSSQSSAGPNSMKISFSCTKPPSSGEGLITFSGDTAFSIKMDATSTIEGKAHTTSVANHGKWLGADCGAVKPITRPPSK